jgi:para-aminobenzoate synthetase/4-amino-4-deoxychorismate lyase
MLSYEAAPAFDPAMKARTPTGFPLAWVAIFDSVETQLGGQGSFPESNQEPDWNPLITRENYRKRIVRIKELITKGDTYQVNYTFPLQAEFQGDTWRWYRHLGRNQGAGYSAYLNLGFYQVLSFSPELFFERKGNLLKTRPMKGTLPRGRWWEEDEFQIQQLRSSAKNRAENIMIVDLLRNDLGKISTLGSVRVTELCHVERYETLLQMTSTIESTIPRNVTLLDLLRALFPCGSITGAPKIRTMEIIQEVESHPRHVYTGTIGYVQPGGDCVFNVAIRTLWYERETGKTQMGVGGGITIDSSADDEYAECLLKSQFLKRQYPYFNLLETLLLENGAYFLQHRHLLRLKRSAYFFGFNYNEAAVDERLDRIRADLPEGRHRIRLLVARDGTIHSETFLMSPEIYKLGRVAFAPQPVDLRCPFLYNKTTCRAVYESQLSFRPDCDDLIFWNERDEVTESSIANIVLESGGIGWTPPRESGLLAGTFRDELLEQGRIRERVINKEELRTADTFFLVNSVRKWIAVQLVE